VLKIPMIGRAILAAFLLLMSLACALAAETSLLGTCSADVLAMGR
jgi:hypothetical protein